MVTQISIQILVLEAYVPNFHVIMGPGEWIKWVIFKFLKLQKCTQQKVVYLWDKFLHICTKGVMAIQTECSLVSLLWYES